MEARQESAKRMRTAAMEVPRNQLGVESQGRAGAASFVSEGEPGMEEGSTGAAAKASSVTAGEPGMDASRESCEAHAHLRDGRGLQGRERRRPLKSPWPRRRQERLGKRYPLGRRWRRRLPILCKGNAATSWDDFPAELLVSLLIRIPCHLDRIHMASSNHHWRRVFRENAHLLPRLLPWLVLPSTMQPLYHDTIGRMTRSLPLPADIKRRARFCGSHEGGWFVLALNQPRAHLIFNINTGSRRLLPTTIIIRGREVRAVMVEAAVLSASPDTPYIVAAIVTAHGRDYSSMAYWQPGRSHWLHAVSPRDDDGRQRGIEDLIYYREAFCYLTSDMNIHVLTPIVGEDGHVHMEWSVLNIDDLWADEPEDEDMRLRRYLVESRGELKMIVKYEYQQIPTIPTGLLRVFRLELDIFEEEAEDDEEEDDFYGDNFFGEPPTSWYVEAQLPGRIVFVGRASSRAFEVQAFDGFQPNSVIFVDDRCVRVPGIAGQFEREDSGTFSLVDLAVQPWPPAGGEVIPPSSDSCPPTWWLH